MTGTYPLYTSNDLDPLLDRVGNAHCVMLGEASHGTHEYYTWRTAISKRLIMEKGFRFLAVEGDWPDCYLLNRYIKGYENQEKELYDLLHTFRRWPMWMWANWEIEALLGWLKTYNSQKAANQRIGFYGLDVYSLWESLEAMNRYLKVHDPHAAAIAAKTLNCFQPYGEDAREYARSQVDMESSCREEVISLLTAVRRSAPVYDHDPEAALNMEQNANIAVNAEAYYTNMVSFNNNTWNIRDQHMQETLNRLMEFHGDEAKAIVWEHNTHIGDASYTNMKDEGLFNIGQLAREEFGRHDVVLVGFGSYSGEVIAGTYWDAPMQVMNVPEAKVGSIEQIMHQQSTQDRMIIFEDSTDELYKRTVPHRAIGVVYHPDREKYGNYVPTIAGSRYDAFIYLDETSALHPIHLHPDLKKIPETYPFTF
ncbi:erythromycin esterase family protein [Chitinophaga sp.]|uniref:erythromycin esterase family protein n=1 Tax=Chitinophaga sp. TaxID=1869181 RepID=UPI0031CE8217